MKKIKTLTTLKFHSEHLNEIISGKVELITPEMAKNDLKSTTFKNRRLKESALQKYKSDLEEGRWQVNGEPIIYDRDGNLVNGFHRLTALSNSNSPGALFFVVRGIDPKAVSTIDCGSVRTVKDRVDINGESQIKNVKTASSALMIREGLKNGYQLRAKDSIASRGITFSHGPYISDSKKLAIFKKESVAINWCISLSNRVKNSSIDLKNLTRGTITGLSLYLLTEKSENLGMISEFFDRLSGKIPDNKLIICLRTKLNKKSISSAETFHYFSKAWEHFKNGETEITKLPKYKPVNEKVD